jgi:PAS domain S-box-containing protein
VISINTENAGKITAARIRMAVAVAPATPPPIPAQEPVDESTPEFQPEFPLDSRLPQPAIARATEAPFLMAAAQAYRPRRYRFEWLLLTAALLLLGASTGWSLLEQGQRIERDQNDHLQTAARGLGELVGQRLLAAERVLITIARDPVYWRGSPDEPALHLEALTGMLDGISALLILDRDGRVLAASRFDLAGRDFSRREFFTRSRQQGDARPLVLDSSAIGEPALATLAVARAIIDERGDFAGAVWAVLDADQLRLLMASARYEPDVWVLLVDAAGKPLLWLPEISASEALALAQTASGFARQGDSGQPDSLLSAIDIAGQAMTIALRSLPAVDPGLLVAVARPGGHGGREWSRLVAWHGGLFLVTLLATVSALSAVQRRQRRIDAVRARYSAEQRAITERMRLAADAAGLGVWEYDPLSRRLNWDAANHALYGVDPATPVTTYEDWRSRVLADDLPAAEAALQAALGDRQEIRIDFRIRRDDGQTRMISARAQPFYAADGSCVRVLGINQDVTERWQAAAALLASEARLQAIFDVVPVGIVVLDPQGSIVDCNATAERLLGIGRGQPLSADGEAFSARLRRPDGSLMPGDENPARQALATGIAVFDVEMMVDTPAGTQWLSVSAVPIAAAMALSPTPSEPRSGDAGEKAHSVVLACIDIGAARRGEAQLRKLSRAVEQSAAAVLITDLDGVIEYVNPAACATYGYSRAELLGAHPRLLSAGQTASATYQALWSTILAGRAWRGELANRRRDGSLIHESILISPVRDRSGRISHFVSIQEDISVRVEAERLQDELKTRLARVARMEVLGVMAGGVAHDFNNILVAILGFSGLGKTVVRAAGGPPRVVSYFEEIETAGERAKGLVQQLLAFSRAGVLKLSMVPVAEVANEVVRLLASSFPPSVSLSASVSDALPALEIDPAHLHRLLVNLCLNARDAIDGPGTASISACLVHFDATAICASCHAEFAGEFLRIAVSDDGCGIPQAIRGRIFEPFFTTREVGSGSGMGLAVVHGLVHLYGGHVQVLHLPRGSEVVILLPRSCWHAAAARLPAAGAR